MLERSAQVVFAIAALLAAGCWGIVETESSGSGGGGSAGVGTGGASASGGTIAGGGGHPNGGGGSGSGGTAGKPPLPCDTPPSPTGPCETLGEVDCVAAYPKCVPLYDDTCCPSCQPDASCANCSKLDFWTCAPMESSSCTSSSALCGTPAKPACAGEIELECLGKGKTACLAWPGCAWAVNLGCDDAETCDGLCRPVTQHGCGTTCEVPLPAGCPSGFHPEGSGGTYGTWCLPDDMCD